jgi:hypothetical protein
MYANKARKNSNSRKKNKNKNKSKITYGFGQDISGSLKDQPMYNNTTPYAFPGSTRAPNLNCPSGLGSDFGEGSLRTLEHNLKVSQNSGPIIGIETPRILKDASGFGRKSRKSMKKIKRKRSRKRGFGHGLAFQNAKLPNAPLYPEHSALGLPSGMSSVNNIYQTMPNPYTRGAPLSRPYGPRDNLRMPLLVDVHGFGKKRRPKQVSKKRNFGRKSKKISKSKKRKSNRRTRKFGSTPGSNTWTNHLAKQTYNGIDYAQPYLATAKGNVDPKMLYFQKGANFDQRFNLAGANVPMQYTKNQLNTPLFTNSFGKSVRKIKVSKRKPKRGSRKSKKKSKKKFGYTPTCKKSRRKSKRSNKSRKSRRKSKRGFGAHKSKRGFGAHKSKRGFGAMTSTSAISGPNNVAYRDAIPMYHAGGTTVDFATGQLYSPIGMVGGPTNSTGSFASLGTFSDPVLTVQADGMTPNAYLNTAAGLDASSSGFNTARSYTHNGIKSGFGSRRSRRSRRSRKSKRSRKFSKPKKMSKKSRQKEEIKELKHLIGAIKKRSKKKSKKIKQLKKSKKRSKRKRKFGNQMYTPDGAMRGTGLLTLSQPLPPYMDKSRDHVSGDYAKFGKNKKLSSNKRMGSKKIARKSTKKIEIEFKLPKKNKPKLTSSIGKTSTKTKKETTITLNNKGNVTMTMTPPSTKVPGFLP